MQIKNKQHANKENSLANIVILNMQQLNTEN